MKSRWFAFLMANTFFLPYSIIAVAGQCDAINKGTGEAVIQAAGKKDRVQPGAWISLNDCANLNILDGGPVQIRGVVGGIPRKTLCEKNGRCSLPPTSKSLVISSTSSYTLVAGARRMDEGVTRKFGIPRGELYSLEAASKFDFSTLPNSPSAFSLFETSGKRQVFQAIVTNNKVAIPPGILNRGVKYTWEVYGSRGRGEPLASGGFNLMSEESAASVSKDIAALDQGDKRGVAEQALDELAVYYEYDLAYEIGLLRDALTGGKN